MPISDAFEKFQRSIGLANALRACARANAQNLVENLNHLHNDKVGCTVIR